jgi:hypothetical protein
LRSFLLLSFSLLFYLHSGSQNLTNLEEELKKHVFILASDSLQGRAVGSTGIKIAQGYIENQFHINNLKPIINGNFLQSFELKRMHKNSALIKIDNKLLFNPWHFYFYSNYNHNDTVLTNVVFAGFASENELKSKSFNGKAIAFYSDDPLKAAIRIHEIHDQYKVQNFFITLTESYTPIGKVFESDYQRSEYILPNRFDKWSDELKTLAWYNSLSGIDSVNVFYCFKDVFKDIFGQPDNELINRTKRLNKDDITMLANLPQPNLKCLLNYNDSVQTIKSNNVIGIIEGKDTSKTIVVSAHYDHLGIEFGKVNYGADDNASGTSALLMISKILNIKYTDSKPLYNIMFIAFSAEELGLLGSEWYVDHPAKSIQNTIININLDMVGRWDERHLFNHNFVYLLCKGQMHHKTYLLGKRLGKQFYGFEVSSQPGNKEKHTFIYGSDQYNFYQKNIPIAVFFTGLHSDYHTYRDTPDKINFSNLARITTIACQLADTISNTPVYK